MGKLTAKAVEKVAPRDKEYRIHDGNGLFFRVRPSGAKSWLFSFNLPGCRKLIREGVRVFKMQRESGTPGIP